MLLGYERDPPNSPQNPGSSPFTSAETSRAPTTSSLYEDARERANFTGLDGAGCRTFDDSVRQEQNMTLGPSPASSTIEHYVSITTQAERPARPLTRKARSIFTSSLGQSIAEE